MSDFDLILYSSPDGNTKVSVTYEDETFWLSQRRMAELFGVDVRTVSEHLQNIFTSGELLPERTIRKFRIVAKDGWIEIEGLRSEFTSLDLKTSLALPTTKPKTLQDQKNVKRLRALYQDLSKQDLK